MHKQEATVAYELTLLSLADNDAPLVEKVAPLEHHGPPPFADFWLRR